MIEIISGDLLKAKEKYICHQTNCLSINSAGLAKSIFNIFPYANTYKSRIKANLPGTIDILGNGFDQRFVINMYAQYYPGYSQSNDAKDTKEKREEYFYQCLLKIAKIPNLESIAFPHNIGCGLAGGDWVKYFDMLQKMNTYLSTLDVKLVIYKKS